MDILISSDDEKAIRYLRRRRATQIDPSGNLWGLQVDSLEELVADLADNAPNAKAWIAQISDFKTVN